MSARKMSNPLALAVLACLSERPMHPYEISNTLRQRGKEQSIKLNYGSLYSVVEALQRHQLIAAVEIRQEGNRPARTTYRITDAGTVELHDWLGELVSTPAKEYPALEAALSLLPILSPDTATELLEQRAERLIARLGESDTMATMAEQMGLPELFRIEDDFGVAMLRAELDFVRQLAQRIRAGSLGGAPMWRRLHELLDSGVRSADIVADPTAYFGEEEARWLGSSGGPPAQDTP